MSRGGPLPRLPAAGLRSLFANHRSGPVPAVRHERADLTHSDAEAPDQVLRIGGRTAHRSTPGATEARWRLPVHSSNHALEPAPHCRLGSPRARRLAKEHIARLCPLTDIDGSTGSTRCALGRGTSTGTTGHGRHILINRGRRPPRGAGSSFSWSVVSSPSSWLWGSWDCRPTILRCAPRHLWKRRGRSYPKICRTNRRSSPQRDAPCSLPTSRRWRRMPTMRRPSSRDPSECGCSDMSRSSMINQTAS